MPNHVWEMCNSLNCLVNATYEWQTIITGLGAITAASVSVHYLRRQIASSEKQEAHRRERRLAAARARLPLSLSDTNSYSGEVLVLLRDALDQLNKYGVVATIGKNTNKPLLPQQAILSLEAVIEATDDIRFSALIASMIAEMQVLDSRLNGLSERAGSGRGNVHSYILNAARIHGYASSMYEYARRETEKPPHSIDHNLVFSALTTSGLYKSAYADVHEFVKSALDRADANL